MSKPETETPETDKFSSVIMAGGNYRDNYEDLKEFARRLESQRNRYRETLKALDDATLALIAEHKLGKSSIMKIIRHKLREALADDQKEGG